MSNSQTTPWKKTAKQVVVDEIEGIIERACREHAAQVQSDIQRHHSLCRLEAGAPDDDVLLERIREMKASIARLRAALEKIVCSGSDFGYAKVIAREALEHR